MSLLKLPPETLIQIFNHIGSSFFRSDLSRLTVCKQWTEFARTACFRDFHVTQKTLGRLLSSPHVETSLRLVKDSTETLDLNLKGFEDWDSINVSSWNDSHGRAVRAAWTTELDRDLVSLATIVKNSRKLRILRIQATSELHPLLRFLERRDYLFLSTTRAFLSPSNLTSLELDLCGTRLVSHQSKEQDEGIHVCTSIAALLNTLQRLRLRMRSICADVLKPPTALHRSAFERGAHQPQSIQRAPVTTSAAHATCCGSSAGGFLQLKADMEKQAQVLVAQMAAPKIVRILTHELPSFETRAFDVLTDRTMSLGEGAEWDDDGEAIEE